MKRLLYVLPTLGPGGAERAAVSIAQNLVDLYGYKVTFFTMYSENYFTDDFNGNLDFVSANLLQKKSKLQKWLNQYIYFFHALKSFINRREFDIIVSGYEIDSEIPLIELALIDKIFVKKRKKIKLISIIQNSILTSTGSFRSDRNKTMLTAVSYGRRLIFDHIVVVTTNIKNEMKEIAQDKITIIPNPINTVYVIAKSNEEIKEENLGWFDEPYYINVARIASQKNQLLLLKAFASIIDKISWNLLMVGGISEPWYHQKISKYINENKLYDRVHHFLPPKNHFPYIRRSRAFVFTSRYEGLPLTILETMALRKIIISIKFTGYENILNSKNSILVDDENVMQLADAMLRLSEGKYEEEKIVLAANDTVRHYEHTIVSEKYHQLFDSLIDPNNLHI
ncbi:MAG: glycosyltransferase [Bacteroidota bacterium]|nr:glycosyltransferase [Bacteroidota bacterium]